MKNINLLILTLLLLSGLPAFAEKVVSVHDGDTLTLEGGKRVRLFGIDAPESAQPLGKDSRDYLKRLVLNQDVSLQCVDESYGRNVCVVRLNDVDIDQKMVLAGWAFDYTHYSNGRYQLDEAQAQSEHKGVWALPNGGERPWVYRHRLRYRIKAFLTSLRFGGE